MTLPTQTRRESKRRLVEQLIKDHPNLSNVKIAGMAMCTRAYVRAIRNNPKPGAQQKIIEAARQRRADAVAFYKNNPQLTPAEVCAKFRFGRDILRRGIQEAGFRSFDEFRHHHLMINQPLAAPPATSLGALLRTRWQRSAVKRALDSVQPIIEEQEAAA